ncbi:putative F-box/LRR-repeat protein 2 [Calycina marina]|uniref:F-box/LRR-repeat protein 2 n=1 Tax=Calycina marina TaxID=1763456 RepID=A0A9P8CIU0_9HELO|nr:putative F-box/LRR-repeat protein 2 [Calycina marina]
MVNVAPDMSIQEVVSTDMPIDNSEAIPIAPSPKLKGRAKLLHNLNRISSSPTLAQIGRRRATSNPHSTRGSLSCVSLALPSSPQNYDSSYSSQWSSGGYSTTPTTTPNTSELESSFGIRMVQNGAFVPGQCTPTSALPLDMRAMSRGGLSPLSSPTGMTDIVEDYFTLPIAQPKRGRRPDFDFWKEMPHEMKLAIFSYLGPKQLVRASIVSKGFYKTCFDGQLWTKFDASQFHMEIPASSLAKIIVAAGPFVKDLNLRGCVQVEHYKRAEVVAKACKNLINATLEGCKNLSKTTLHTLLRSNQRLAHLNLTGLSAVTNQTCRIIAQSCPSLEVFNVSWCDRMDARGIKYVVLNCPRLKDIRAGEIRGFDEKNLDVAQAIFDTNTLERLELQGSGLSDDALKIMVIGNDPEIDILTDLAVVPARKLRILNLSRCSQLTSAGVKRLAHSVPDLEVLHLSGCSALTDNALSDIIATTPRLTHLEIEDLSEITNSLFTDDLAKAPSAPHLEYLSISSCEKVGDVGMLPVIRACTSLQTLKLDNTRCGDLVLAEAAPMIRARASRTTNHLLRPVVGLRIEVYDCQNVTWTGIREVLSRNSEVRKPTGQEATYPTEIIELKCFYGWQDTVREHQKRVLRGDLPAAGRLERKWAEYMMANEEAGAGGAGVRRRRRRAREAQMLHADEEEGGLGIGGIGRRRRARSGGCAVM